MKRTCCSQKDATVRDENEPRQVQEGEGSADLVGTSTSRPLRRMLQKEGLGSLGALEEPRSFLTGLTLPVEAEPQLLVGDSLSTTICRSGPPDGRVGSIEPN